MGRVESWRTHSCVPRRHSCRRLAFRKTGVEMSLDTGTQKCVRHIYSTTRLRQ
jgi:hypothetical protein